MSAEERPDVKTLKSNLAKRAGLRKDTVTATRQFQSRQGERVNRYLTDLKRLYNEAFPEEEVTSKVFLTKFVSDLRPDITQQLLLQGQPDSLENAVKQATNIEQVLGLGEPDVKPVFQVETAQVEKLCEAVAAVMAQVKKLQQNRRQGPRYQSCRYQGSGQYQGPRRGRFQPDRRSQERSCWHCQERGHLRRDCPHLNSEDPAC